MSRSRGPSAGSCTISPDCGYGPHARSDHPCGQPIHGGDPCKYCGDPIQADAAGVPIPCPRCWTPIPANLADAKALLALGGLSLDRHTAD